MDVTQDAFGTVRDWFWAWDPIGVAFLTGGTATDEYDSYLPATLEFLLTRPSQVEVLAYLWRIETSLIGLTGNRERTRAFAKDLHARFTTAEVDD